MNKKDNKDLTTKIKTQRRNKTVFFIKKISNRILIVSKETRTAIVTL